ncbi:ABC transporter permease [Desulfurobacterium sp.]
MNKLIEWFSLRTVKPRKGGSYLSFVFLIAVLGVVVGVAALIIVNSVMTGFQSAIKERLLASNADIIVMGTELKTPYREAEEKISSLPHVKGVEPFIYIPVMVSAGAHSFSGGTLRGCVPSKEPKITDIPSHLVMGNWKDFEKTPNGAVVGETLANTVGISVGDTITLITPMGTKTPFGYIPKTGRFKVVGIFNVGMYQFDSALVLAHIGTVKEMFNVKQPTGLMVKLDNPDNVKLVEQEIRKALGPGFVVNDWISMNKSLFSALKLEKLAMFLILTLIVIVASFNISSLLMMNVNYRSKDIAILKTLGAQDGFILKIFMAQGFLIGIIGTAIGEFLGIGISYIGEKYKLIALPPDVYYIDHLPFKLQASDCIIAGIAAILISVLATIYPAKKAAKTDPIKVLRAGEN